MTLAVVMKPFPVEWEGQRFPETGWLRRAPAARRQRSQARRQQLEQNRSTNIPGLRLHRSRRL